MISVEVRDVLIPPGLQDAMSMQAQAERERQARVILGDSERQVAEKFGEAAQDLRGRSRRAPPARDEHALRRAQAERDDRARSELRARDDAAGRYRRRRRPFDGGIEERSAEGSALRGAPGPSSFVRRWAGPIGKKEPRSPLAALASTTGVGRDERGP